MQKFDFAIKYCWVLLLFLFFYFLNFISFFLRTFILLQFYRNLNLFFCAFSIVLHLHWSSLIIKHDSELLLVALNHYANQFFATFRSDQMRSKKTLIELHKTCPFRNNLYPFSKSPFI